MAPRTLQAEPGRLLLAARISKSAPKSVDAKPVSGAAAGSEDCLEVTECRQHFESARRLSESRQYNAALTSYEKAYALRASPWLLINIGRVQQKLGHPSEAVVSFKRFLAEAEHQPAEAVQAAREYLQQAESDLAGLREKERTAAAPLASTNAPPAPAPKLEEKPVYKKWWFWVALGGAAVAVSAAVAVGVTVGTASTAEPERAPFHIAF